MNLKRNNTQKAIDGGKTVLGFEFGSTRIKAVLIGVDHALIASGRRPVEFGGGLRSEKSVTVSQPLVFPGLETYAPP